MKRKLTIALGIMCLITLIQSVAFFLLTSSIQNTEEQLDQAQKQMEKSTSIQMQHYKWLQGLTMHIYTGSEFTGSLDHTACSLGQWLGDEEYRQNANQDMLLLMDKIAAPHKIIHDTAGQIVAETTAGNTDVAIQLFNANITTNIDNTISLLDDIIAISAEQETKLMADSEAAYSSARMLLAALAACSVACGVIALLILVRSIVPPLHKLTGAADRLAVGDLHVDADMGKRSDELGELSRAFRRIIDATRTQSTLVQGVAEGDLTVDIYPRDNADTLNINLQRMVTQNNSAISEINSMINEINLGSNSISSSAESLASGATEQAGATEELSGNIESITRMAMDTHKITNRLIALTSDMRNSAEESNAQMQQMVKAVKAIQDASENIKKIVKVIESIAFQTNILSLNASVEAARAGQHGKGFAVVAEEVRELAEKSAEAASQTTKLIAESTQSAVSGVGIAEQTEQSLNRIIEQINEASEVIAEIGRGNSELHQASEQLLIGIEQVSEVVQANSASSEELAASSESLSQLSDSLEKIAGQYKLKQAYGIE